MPDEEPESLPKARARVPASTLLLERLQSDPVFVTGPTSGPASATPKKQRSAKKSAQLPSTPECWLELLDCLQESTHRVEIKTDSFTLQFSSGILVQDTQDSPTLTLLLHGEQGTMLTPKPETTFDVVVQGTVYRVLYLGGNVRLGLHTQLLTFIVEDSHPDV